jgi:hypothetical protein
MMQLHTSEKAENINQATRNFGSVVANDTLAISQSGAINELQLGESITSAVSQERRADFALLLAMFSQDIRETISVEHVDISSKSESQLRDQLQVPRAGKLRSDQESYSKSAQIAEQFHHSGMMGARLQNGLNPDSLAYMAERTHNLEEEVFHNLSYHAQRILTTKPKPTLSHSLHQALQVNRRESEMATFA